MNLASFADGSEENHLFFNLGFDSFNAWFEEFAWVIALGSVLSGWGSLAGFAVFFDRTGEDELALGVDVDLADAVFDGVGDLVIWDAGATVENEWDVAGSLVDFIKGVEVEAFPASWIETVDVADTGSEEIDSEFDHLGAFFWISDFAVSGDAVFGTTDGTNFGLDG